MKSFAWASCVLLKERGVLKRGAQLKCSTGTCSYSIFPHFLVLPQTLIGQSEISPCCALTAFSPSLHVQSTSSIRSISYDCCGARPCLARANNRHDDRSSHGTTIRLDLTALCCCDCSCCVGFGESAHTHTTALPLCRHSPSLLLLDFLVFRSHYSLLLYSSGSSFCRPIEKLVQSQFDQSTHRRPFIASGG